MYKQKKENFIMILSCPKTLTIIEYTIDGAIRHTCETIEQMVSLVSKLLRKHGQSGV